MSGGREVVVESAGRGRSASTTTDDRHGPPPSADRPLGEVLVHAEGLARRFGAAQVFEGVSLAVRAGQIHGLLGPNGAGKSTLLRILAGSTDATEGRVRLAGGRPLDRRVRQLTGLVPAGDRTFYLRLSGRENLLFYGRLYGMRPREVRRRTDRLLEAVGLTEAAGRPVRLYSQGMMKRLATARGLITRPLVMLCDEATHDLDPTGADDIRALVREAADGGTAVVWATQIVDEVRGFADTVTVLGGGGVRFDGPVAEFVKRARIRRYLVRLEDHESDLTRLRSALGSDASVESAARADPGEFVLELRGGTMVLSDAFARLSSAGFRVVACREERSEVEQALLEVTRGGDE